MTQENHSQAALEMRGISKTYLRNQVLFDVDFHVPQGRVKGLVGANGAGKSTLMKIAEGVVEPDTGSVRVGGRRMTFDVHGETREAGLGMVFQELSLIPELTVAENVFLNSELTRAGLLIRRSAEIEEATELFSELGVSVDPRATVSDLGAGERQIVEVVKALQGARTALILDEPTAALEEDEVERLFDAIREVTKLGVGVVLISHYLSEVFEICDEVTVLRDGRVTLDCAIDNTDMDEVVTAMVGEELEAPSTSEAFSGVGSDQPARLETNGLSIGAVLRDIDLEVRPGEIVGLAGLAGSGRTELLTAIYGARRVDAGTIRRDGQPVAIRSPADAIAAGIYLIPEKRQEEGLLHGHTVRDNLTVSVLEKVRVGFLWSRKKTARIAQEFIEDLAIKITGQNDAVDVLSGGNQQKVILGKAFATEPEVFLLDEPTFGVDIKTSLEIMDRMRELASTGAGLLWTTSELDELIRVSDRLLIMVDGRVIQSIENRQDKITEKDLTAAIQPDKADGNLTGTKEGA